MLCSRLALVTLLPPIITPQVPNRPATPSQPAGPWCCLKSCEVEDGSCPQPTKESGVVSGARDPATYDKCAGSECFTLNVDWASGNSNPARVLHHPSVANFSVRKLEAFYYPPDGKTYVTYEFKRIALHGVQQSISKTDPPGSLVAVVAIAPVDRALFLNADCCIYDDAAYTLRAAAVVATPRTRFVLLLLVVALKVRVCRHRKLQQLLLSRFVQHRGWRLLLGRWKYKLGVPRHRCPARACRIVGQRRDCLAWRSSFRRRHGRCWLLRREQPERWDQPRDRGRCCSPSARPLCQERSAGCFPYWRVRWHGQVR